MNKKMVMLLALVASIAGVASATVIETYKDGYVQNGSETNKNFGAESHVLVKLNDNATSYTRRGYFGFDYSSVSNGAITSVTLNLNFIDSHLGSLTSNGDFEFGLYGLNTSPWDESTITWNNAPGFTATFLGNFSRTGKGIGSMGFSSDELLSFVQNDSDRLVSLVLVRNTGTDHGDYVHAIGTKEGSNASSLNVTIPEPAVISLIGLISLLSIGLNHFFQAGKATLK